MGHGGRRRMAAAALASALALSLAACSSSGDGGQPSDPTSGRPPMPTTTFVEFPTGSAPADSVTFRPVLDGTRIDAEGQVTVDALGPAAVDGTALEGASASFNEQNRQWTVSPVFTDQGIGEFNQVAARCFQKGPTCPTGQLAIVVDGVVLSAPTINESGFERDQISISGGFDEAEAQDLARQISAAAHGAA